jgi:hypothetical protein
LELASFSSPLATPFLMLLADDRIDCLSEPLFACVSTGSPAKPLKDKLEK